MGMGKGLCPFYIEGKFFPEDLLSNCPALLGRVTNFGQKPFTTRLATPNPTTESGLCPLILGPAAAIDDSP
jgi:hypothetical protein